MKKHRFMRTKQNESFTHILYVTKKKYVQKDSI